MTKKTYAARGLLDWQLALNVAGAIIRICFSGGSMGSNGVVPAKYTTDNEAIQRLIENTDHFRKGRIFVVAVMPVDSCNRVQASGVKSQDKKPLQKPGK